MWDTRKVLLAAVVFTALYYSVAAERATRLDMAPDAVDYLFAKCRKEAMEKFIHSGLLRQEMNLSTGFQKAWSRGTQCSKLIPGGTKEHTAALLAYADGDEEFTKTFDNDVKTMGANDSTYENNFNFKSLHFLLMDSVMLTKPRTCETAYVITLETDTAREGSKVRLGRFTKAEADFIEMKKWTDLIGQVVLNITSCYFVKLGDNICGSEKGKLLLSPAEMFTVEDVNTRGLDDGDSYTEIVLKNSGLKTSPSCHLVSRSPTAVSTQWLVLVLVASSLFSVHLLNKRI